MKDYGRINCFGRLEYAPDAIKEEDGTIVLNPTMNDYLRLGYKYIIVEPVPEELIGKNTEIYYEQDVTTIYVKIRESVEIEGMIDEITI